MKLFWPVYLTVAIGGTVVIYMYAPRFRLHPQQLVQQIGGASDDASRARAQVNTEEDSEMPPASYGVMIARRSDSPLWGITIQETSFYTEKGKRLGDVKGGAILLFKKEATSSKGNVVACSFPESKAIYRDRIFLLQKKNILLFTGKYQDLPPSQLTALKDYYEARTNVRKYKEDLLVKLASKNPYFKEYQNRYKTYMSMISKATELEKKRQEAKTNVSKNQYLSQLEHLRLQEAQMKPKYEEIRMKYNDWKKMNSHMDEEIGNDKKLQSLQQDLRALGRKIPGLAI